MADVFTKKKRAEIMRRIQSTDTGPEIAVRRALHRLGFRYTLHAAELPGKPDIVLNQRRTAIQIRGCFWHSHSCQRGHLPKTGRGYWVPKLLRNQLRDARNDAKLRRIGWSVCIVWECRCRTRQALTKEVARLATRIRHRTANGHRL